MRLLLSLLRLPLLAPAREPLVECDPVGAFPPHASWRAISAGRVKSLPPSFKEASTASPCPRKVTDACF